MAEKINVKSKLGKRPDGGFPLAIHEKNDDHEGGELFIADDKVHSVVATTAVMTAITEGRLERTDEKAGSTFEPGLATDKELVIFESDDAESLEKRYSKAELVELAKSYNVEVDDTKTKAEIANTILGSDVDREDDPEQ
jgi:hypothetical protein